MGVLFKKKVGVLIDLVKNFDKIKLGMGLWDDVNGLFYDLLKMLDEIDVFGIDFIVMLKEVMIKILIIYIYGVKDLRWLLSV